MREIKFRAWNGHKLITPAFELNNDGTQTHYSIDLGVPADLDQDLTKYTWMQHTGLKDKDSRDIYEGDIVEYFDWCYASERADGPGRGIIEHPFTPFGSPAHVNYYKPLKGVVKWNAEALTYEPLVNSSDDYNKNSFGYVCGSDGGYNDKSYPENYVRVIGNIYENPELTKNSAQH